MAQKNERQKKAGLLNREGSVRYRPSCLSRQGGTEKISRVTTATSSTMVLDSSGTCDGERRMAVGNVLGDCG
jgi:hypothetical protein